MSKRSPFIIPNKNSTKELIEAELQVEAERLIREKKMPSLERVIDAVARVRVKFRPLIERARKNEKVN